MSEIAVFLCLFCVPAQAGEESPQPPARPAEALATTPQPPARLELTDPPVELPRRYRPTPPELVAEAMMLPAGHTLAGQPMTLASVLSAARERPEQLEVVRTYWQLVEAVAVYRFQHEYDRRLQELDTPPEFAARMAAARAASKARLGEAELRVVAAQHALAVQAGFPIDSALPLPADHPHVGQYITRFRELFGSRIAPPAAQRLDRTLPIRFQAIEAQAGAVAAALDAHQIITEDLEGSSLDAQLDCLAELNRLQRDWIAAVCRYNQDIAEYAVAVAPIGTNGAGLVALLIKPEPDRVRPLVSDEASAVQPAGLIEPIQPAAAAPRQPTGPELLPEFRREPTPAVRPPAGEPTPAVRPPAGEPTPAVRPPGGEPTPAVRPPAGEPTPARHSGEAAAPSAEPRPAGATEDDSGSVLPERPVVPIDPQALKTQPTGPKLSDPAEPAPLAPALFEVDGEASALPGGDAKRPGAQSRTAQRPVAALSPLYPGLAEASPGVRTKQLNLTLHWNRSLPSGSGEPIELLDCLGRRQGDRGGLIAAYWTTRERAAVHQVWQQHRQWLDELSHAMPGASPGVWRLRVARLAAEAASVAAHAELVESQFRLAEATGQSADAIWPLPATRPHSGQYLLKIESLPPELANTQPLRRLADMLPRLSANVRERATAVVEADAARVETEAAWLGGAATFSEVLHAVDRHTGQTLAFLEALTAYNHAIADYALHVLPEAAPDDLLVQALVMPE